MSDTKSRQVSGFLPVLWILAVMLWALSWGNFATSFKSEFVAIFAIHIALHLSLGWSNLFAGKHDKLQLLYFGVQGLLVLSLTLLSPTALESWTIINGLYLVLIGEATIMLRRTGLIILLVGSYLLLSLLGFFVNSHTTWGNWGPYMFFVPLLLPLVPFAVGYLQAQARARDRAILQAVESAHAQLAATHSELETAHQRLATYATQVEELTRLTERQRLARDLHDTLAQGLSALILQLEVTHSRLAQGRTAQAQALVQEALDDARQVLDEARCAIDHLRAESRPGVDFLEHIEHVSGRFTTMTGIPCFAELAGLADCPALLHEHISRIISECLINVARHAQARHVWIAVRKEEARITLEVRDDGIGFDPVAETRQQGHYGLIGMRERTRLLGGELELTSASGAGTSLHVLLPYAGKGDRN